MFTPWHKTDFQKLPDEDRTRDGLRALAIPPGDYMTPCPSSHAEMKSPEIAKKVELGPRMVMPVMQNGATPVGKTPVSWLAFSLGAWSFAASGARPQMQTASADL